MTRVNDVCDECLSFIPLYLGRTSTSTSTRASNAAEWKKRPIRAELLGSIAGSSVFPS